MLQRITLNSRRLFSSAPLASAVSKSVKFPPPKPAAKPVAFTTHGKGMPPPPRRLTRFDVPPEGAPGAPTRAPRSQYRYHALRELLSSPELPPCSVVSSRDFIHNSLYNPYYGYFSKQARIWQMLEPIDCTALPSALEFMNAVGDQYDRIETRLAAAALSTDADASEGASSSGEVDDITRQIWHTPTELFKPWYGAAIARHIVRQHLGRHGSTEPLRIYEVGGGNGTLMANVLDHVREHHPALYEHARYTIIEISANLAAIQRKTASDKGHTSCVHIVNESVFGDELGGTSTSAEVTDDGPCTVIALEVIDNLAHDVVRYDLATRAPLRGMVASDEYAEYSEEYVPVTAGAPAANGGHEDAALVRALALHAHVGAGGPGRGDPWWTATAALVSPRVRAAATAAIPFAPNLSRRAFVPTNLLVLFETLKRRFPRHSLVMSDFSSLPETTSPTERNAPVVQTRFERSMVPVSTYLVQPGFFDIFFPTEFETARRMYAAVMRDEYVVGRVTEAGERAIRDAERTGRSMRAGCLGDVLPSTFTAFPASVWSHRAFLEANADLKATTTRSGENPMLMYYENCAVMTS